MSRHVHTEGNRRCHIRGEATSRTSDLRSRAPALKVHTDVRGRCHLSAHRSSGRRCHSSSLAAAVGGHCYDSLPRPACVTQLLSKRHPSIHIVDLHRHRIVGVLLAQCASCFLVLLERATPDIQTDLALYQNVCWGVVPFRS